MPKETAAQKKKREAAEQESGDNVVSLEERRLNAKVVGRAELMKGVGAIETPYFEEIDAKVQLRRVGSGEWAEVEALQAQGIILEGQPDNVELDEDGNPDPNASGGGLNMKINVAESTRGEARARHQLVAYALSVKNGDKYTEADIASLDNVPLVRAIAAKCYEISGVSPKNQEDIKRLRENTGGGEDSVDESSGVSDS